MKIGIIMIKEIFIIENADFLTQGDGDQGEEGSLDTEFTWNDED